MTWPAGWSRGSGQFRGCTSQNEWMACYYCSPTELNLYYGLAQIQSGQFSVIRTVLKPSHQKLLKIAGMIEKPQLPSSGFAMCSQSRHHLHRYRLWGGVSVAR
jgi:hypothetical protein